MKSETPKPVYDQGDCIVEVLGVIELKDGRVFRGAILTFPAGPPKLPISIVWDRVPVRLDLKQST
jgi:hypothetical protein